MPAFLDLTGETFVRLTVIERHFVESKKTYWKCKCECGNISLCSTNDLRRGDKKSCGCLRKDLLRIDLTGKIFGKLTVIKIGKKRGNSSSEFWDCKCECGNTHTVSSQHLRKNQVKSCGCWFNKNEEKLLNEAKERFFAKVEKKDSCWIWKGPMIKGYGIMFYKKPIKAHRFSYMIHKGELVPGKLVCHTCDNASCVNPDHLYLGTPKDNSRDAFSRGRMKVGSNHHKAKITEKDLIIIHNRKNKGIDLAKQFGLSENQISRIRNFKGWNQKKCPQEVF